MKEQVKYIQKRQAFTHFSVWILVLFIISISFVYADVSNTSNEFTDIITNQEVSATTEIYETNNELDPQYTFTVPLINKTVNLEHTSIIATTILLAFIDGFNPCSLWLLLFLIGVLVLTKSRKKMLLVGLTFLLVTAVAYGTFISGLFSIFFYVSYLQWIKIFVGILALIFAIINIKDYFWYKKGISLTISDSYKPTLFKKIRNIMHPDKSIWQMVGATAILALGVTLVELPCTAGIPLIWSNLVSMTDVTPTGFVSLLGLYLFIYLGIEIIVLIIALITMHKFNFEEKHGRILKLISGVVMLLFAIGFVFAYQTMNSFVGVIAIMFISFVLVGLIILVDKIILPYFGIQIGSNRKRRVKK